jgi:hypothetical protein
LDRSRRAYPITLSIEEGTWLQLSYKRSRDGRAFT